MSVPTLTELSADSAAQQVLQFNVIHLQRIPLDVLEIIANYLTVDELQQLEKKLPLLETVTSNIWNRMM